MKTLWYINHYAGGPGLRQAYRSFELASRFDARGCRTAVVMASFNDPPTQHEHHPSLKWIEGIPYVTVKTNAYQGNGIGRLLSIAIFSVRLFWITHRMPASYESPNAIVVSSVHPFAIYAGARLARKHGARLIFEIRDLWPLTLTTLLRMSERSPFVRLCAMAERYAIRHADLVVSVLPQVDRYLQDNGLKYSRFAWMPNGASMLQCAGNESLTSQGERALNVIDEWHAARRLIVVHAGSLGPPNAVDLLIDAVSRINVGGASPSLSVMLIGDGVNRHDIQARGNSTLGEDFHHAGQLSKSETQRLVEHCDIGYAGIRALPDLYRYGIGMNKLPTYMDAALPIVLPTEACGDAVSESGGGVTGHVESPDDLAKLLLKVSALSLEDRKAMGQRGRDYMLHYLDYDKIADNYLREIFDAEIRIDNQ